MVSHSEQGQLVRRLFHGLEKRETSPAFIKRPVEDFWVRLYRIRDDIESHCTDRKSNWSIYGESFKRHLQDFASVFTLDELRALDCPSGLVMVDALGPGNWIKELINQPQNYLKHRIKRGLAVTLSDERSNTEKEVDSERGVFELVPGNIFVPEVVEAFWTALGEDTIDFLMCRPYAGITKLPLTRHPLNLILMFGFVKEVYAHTSSGGILLFQIPKNLEALVGAWGEKITATDPQAFKISRNKQENNFVFFKLVKTVPNLPEFSLSELRAL